MMKNNNRQVKKSNNTNTTKNDNSNALAKKLDKLLSRIPKGSFATVGGALGGPTGAAIGKGISMLTGYGDYTVSSNTLANKTVVGEMADQVPIFRQQGADTNIKHCEYVMDVIVPDIPSDFNVTTLQINPVDATTFPWLASVAKKYQRYKVRGMVIGYRSTSTDYNNNGVIAIAVNYDPAEQAYSSMEGLLNTKFAVSTKPSMSMLAPVECDPARSPMDGYYVKHVTSGEVNDATIRQVAMGNINVATSGLSLPAGTTLGQLYISYDIEFLYPYLHTLQSFEPSGSFLKFIAYTVPLSTQVVAPWLDGDLVTTDTPNALQCQVVMDHQPDQISAATPYRNWYHFVMAPGKYEVSVFDGPWYDGSNSVSGGTYRAARAASGVNIVVENESKFSDTLAATYTIVVSKGTDAERTFEPASFDGRTKVGSGSFVNWSFDLKRID